MYSLFSVNLLINNTIKMKKYILVIFLFAFAGLASAQQLSVASYNIRYSNKQDSVKGNGWERRCPIQLELIKYNDFDIWGAQEVLHSQLLDLTKALPDYAYIGVGREDGKQKGEYAPIFYKKGRFELLSAGNFWLSENQDIPNKGWDAAFERICTWGKFKDKDNNAVFWFFNLHMDHKGVIARRESAKLVLSKVKEMADKDYVILTGDFNVDQKDESYALIAESEIFDDSYETARIRFALNGTINGFNPNRYTESRIDHIFVSKSFTVDRYAILTDTYRTSDEISSYQYIARTPSDHFPVVVRLNYVDKK